MPVNLRATLWKAMAGSWSVIVCAIALRATMRFVEASRHIALLPSEYQLYTAYAIWAAVSVLVFFTAFFAAATCAGQREGRFWATSGCWSIWILCFALSIAGFAGFRISSLAIWSSVAGLNLTVRNALGALLLYQPWNPMVPIVQLATLKAGSVIHLPPASAGLAGNASLIAVGVIGFVIAIVALWRQSSTASYSLLLAATSVIAIGGGFAHARGLMPISALFVHGATVALGVEVLLMIHLFLRQAAEGGQSGNAVVERPPLAPSTLILALALLALVPAMADVQNQMTVARGAQMPAKQQGTPNGPSQTAGGRSPGFTGAGSNATWERRVYLAKAVLDAAAERQWTQVDSRVATLKGSAFQFGGNVALARDMNRKGLSAFRRADYTEALKYFETASNANASDVEALNNYAFTLMKLGRYSSAIAALWKTLALSPERTSAWVNLSEALATYASDARASEAAMLLAVKYANRQKARTFLIGLSQSQTNTVYKSVASKVLLEIEAIP